MSFVVLANFKSNQKLEDLKTWIAQLSPALQKYSNTTNLIIAPSSIHLPATSSLIAKNALPIKLASQDVSPFPPGAYTGAINATQLLDYHVSYSLIGHSERRRYFHETHPEINNKARELTNNNITPIICLSRGDISPQFAALDDDLQEKCYYCFEPPADIGGTVTAPLDVIQDTVDTIKKYVSAPVLYGGSVTPDNLSSLLSLKIAGVLVATASLQPTNIISMFETLSHAR